MQALRPGATQHGTNSFITPTTSDEVTVALAIAMVMTTSDALIDVHALAADFRSRWPDQPPPTDVAADGATFSFRVGTHDVIAGAMPAPIPWSELEGPCATSLLWPSATNDVRAHTHHHIVTVSGELAPLDLAALLTRSVASILSVLPGAIGVYWGSAPLVAPRTLFLEFAEQVLPGAPPLPIWVDIRAWRDGATSTGFTSGLAALGCRELEAAGAPESPSELYGRLLELAEYVVRNPDAIADGHTVGRNANEKIQVRIAASSYDRSGDVMRLEFGAPKKRWKLW